MNLVSELGTILVKLIINTSNHQNKTDKLIKILVRDLPTRFKRGIPKNVGMPYRDFDKF